MYRTLILDEGQYKRYLPKTTVVGGDLVPRLTSYQGGGVVVSDNGTTNGREGWKLFDRSTTASTNFYNSSNSISWVKVDFGENNQKVVYSFSLTYGEANATSYPADWQIQGSNDNSTWETIYSMVGDNGWTRGGTRTFTVEPSKEKPYRYIRLYMSRLVGGNTGRLAELKLLGRDINTPSKWEVVSESLPSSTEFDDKGMNSLEGLFGRTVQNLNPQEMTLDSTFVGEGKLFRKSVDLNKYFDLRTITTETRNS